MSELLKKPESLSVDSSVLNFVLSVILQYTDELNFRVLTFYSDHRDSLDPLKGIYERQLLSATLRTVFRLFDAQPFLRALWDTSALFDINLEVLDPNDQLICHFLRDMVHHEPDSRLHLARRADESSLATLSGINWMDSHLRLNKRDQQLKRQGLAQELGELSRELIRRPSPQKGSTVSSGEGLVSTPYLLRKADEAVAEMETSVFRHFAVVGNQGSGKMSFVRLMKERAGDLGQNFIVVTLEETFDSKNLVGTYVCNETGEFVFKKGPLTVAAEQGLWLILRNIDQSPPDLLSFLLPLVQENKLQVTSAFSITPKLGFRIVALCHGSNSRGPSQSLDDSSGIAPFLSQLHLLTLDHLEAREDF